MAAAHSCLESLPLSVDKSLRIKAAHSLFRAEQCIWPNRQRYEAKGDVLLLEQAIAEAQEASLDPAAIVHMQLTMATILHCSVDCFESEHIHRIMQLGETLEPVYR